MANRLAGAISPYLRSHSNNPVDWFPWGDDAFAAAARRDVPVLISIGYSTCHWCHVMARESFSDPPLAAYLNEHFVAIKVDREEHPEVDESYLAAASAFIGSLGWPLNAFATPEGKAFYAGTYFPPRSIAGHPAFRQVLEAVTDAWTQRRDQLEVTAESLSAALQVAVEPSARELPTRSALEEAAAQLAASEDQEYGGLGSAPKFPMAPALRFLLTVPPGQDLACRTLRTMAGSPMHDPVDGGFFRYATQRDWSEPHYERMLYDNALLLGEYTDVWKLAPERNEWAARAARSVAAFLVDVLQLDSGAFASAQDSESIVDGRRVEGDHYYGLPAPAREAQSAPGLDEKVLTGWNGLAISALARAAFAFDQPEWLAAARAAAHLLIERHMGEGATLARASVGDKVSSASATLEDYGMFSCGLLDLAAVTGDCGYAHTARALMDGVLAAGIDDVPFGVPGGGDAVLEAKGLRLALDGSEGAYPSGLSSCASAVLALYLLGAGQRYLDAARRSVTRIAGQALANPVSFGAALAVMSELAEEPTQLVVIVPDDRTPPAAVVEEPLVGAARSRRSPALVSVATAAQASAFADDGFELFAGRTADTMATAYLCRDFVCQLPVTDPAALG